VSLQVELQEVKRQLQEHHQQQHDTLMPLEHSKSHLSSFTALYADVHAPIKRWEAA
jgi:hypothetical protein